MRGGTLIGAYLASWIDWRAAFLVMGVARHRACAGHADGSCATVPRPSGRGSAAEPLLRDTFPLIARKPTFWLMAAAASCSSLAGYGLALWTPTVLERSFGLR